MKKKLLMGTLLSLSLLLPLTAAELNVDDAIALAKENSISLMSADIDIETAQRTQRNAYFSLLPSVNAGVSMARSNTGTSYGPVSIENNVSMAFSLSLSYAFNPAMVTSLKVNPINTELSYLEKEAVEAETEANVKKLFYGLLLQRESFSVQNETLEAYRERYESAKEKYANGFAMELEVLQAEVSYENKKSELDTLKRTITQQEMSFKYLLGLPLDEELTLVGDLSYTVPALESLKAGYTNSLEQFDKQLEVLNVNRRALQLQTYVPSISLSASYVPTISDITGTWNSDAFRDMGSLSVTVAFNLTNLLPSSTAHQNIKSVDENIRKIALGKKAQQDANELTVAQAKENLMSIESAISQSSSTIELAEKSLEATRELYDNGYSTLLDLKDAEDQVQLAKLSLLSQSYNYISALIDLEQVTGTKLI